jgi:hypothetical protein
MESADGMDPPFMSNGRYVNQQLFVVKSFSTCSCILELELKWQSRLLCSDLQALSITASEEDAEDVTIELTSDSDSDSETSSAENAKSALKRRDAGEEHNVLKQEILTVTAGNHATMEYAHAVFIEEPESESADDQARPKWNNLKNTALLGCEASEGWCQ